MNLDFGIAAGKAYAAELDECAGFLLVLHRSSSLLRGKNVCQQFKTHLVIVLHNSSFSVL